jgi:leader peptidase (prepilin peptidase)/N-methyltransferase
LAASPTATQFLDAIRWVEVVVAAGLGLAFGSFVTVVAYRIPRKESIVSPGSGCPVCGARIRRVDNVPVLSWILLGGSCRSCGARISFRYPSIELGTATLWMATFFTYGEDLYVALVLALFFTLLLAVTLIDLEHRIIPNRLTYPALAVFAALLLIGRAIGAPLDLLDALLGLLLYGGGMLLVAVLYPRGMGMGDVKLAAVIGMVVGSLGLGLVAVAAMLGFFLGAAVGMAVMAVGHKGRKTAVPFGPFLAAGAVLSVFAGDAIIDWYLSFFT